MDGRDIRYNGQLGIGGIGDDVLVDGNEIAFNNTAGFHPGWEAGATKFARTHNLVVRNNWSHHNRGPGFWTDIDNMRTLYEGNLVEDNRGIGIFHEISYDAIIRNNTVRRNGLNYHPWLWGAGIVIAGSKNVEIYDNVVTDNGNGITAVQQKRGSGAYGPWVVDNLWVHHNTITMTTGLTGLGQDVGDQSYFTKRNNRFTNNTYVTKTSNPWLWGAGIVVAASPNVEVYGNLVEHNGNGIVAVQQKRGNGDYGPWIVENLWVHDNEVVMSQGVTGLGQDIGDQTYYTSRKNRFSNNRYTLETDKPFFWMDRTITEGQWRDYGLDSTGEFDR